MGPLNPSTRVLWLGESECGERPITGGKAANLSRMARRFNVPAGFCVVSEGELTDPPPPELPAELEAAYGRLGERLGLEAPPVAVRSSAADEDGSAASFAGQHETFLNVRGIDALQQAVMDCWASGGSERVRKYRHSFGLPPEAGQRLPVLVQSLVLADASAVVFTANPLTSDRGEIVINASWGLGESLVAGSVNPDTYLLARDELSLRSTEVGVKRRMTVTVPGGTQEVEVPSALQRAPAVDDEAVLAMARLGVELDETFGWPVDVECCLSGTELHLLQCRPITGLGSEERSREWPLTNGS